MTSSDDVTVPEPPAFQELRRSILSSAPPPAADVADVARLKRDVLETIRRERIIPRATEIRVRLAGDGVPANDIPVHVAARILDSMQGAVTAVGSTLKKQKRAKTPKGKDGHRLGVRKATELRLSPTISPGSVVFHLEGLAEPEPQDGQQLTDDGSDSLVDLAVVELFRLLEQAEEDRADAIGELTTRLQHMGAMVSSKLNMLAEGAADSQIELDLGHWSPSGARSAAKLGRRGVDAIREAVDRNRERIETSTLIGTLRTVSDGSDMLRMTLDDETGLRLTVDPALGVSLGSLLGERIIAEVETTIKWKIATGVERRTHRLTSAAPAEGEKLVD